MNRRPKGAPGGGQFATNRAGEPPLTFIGDHRASEHIVTALWAIARHNTQAALDQIDPIESYLHPRHASRQESAAARDALKRGDLQAARVHLLSVDRLLVSTSMALRAHEIPPPPGETPLQAQTCTQCGHTAIGRYCPKCGTAHPAPPASPA